MAIPVAVSAFAGGWSGAVTDPAERHPGIGITIAWVPHWHELRQAAAQASTEADVDRCFHAHEVELTPPRKASNADQYAADMRRR
ncbi:hypothetical protein [Streptomyces sp. SLBN-8D4]|uniref:hypothetical protein n=1 Tax=Streptomyces sp. SLBN-8D4 TaxID=3377728 RepID=UPI003C799493